MASSSAQQITSNVTLALYKSRKTILELLKTQDYEITEHENFSINDIHSMQLNNQMDMLVSKKMPETSGEAPKKVYVKYYLESKIIRDVILNNIVEDLFETPDVDVSPTAAPILNKDRDTVVIILANEPNDTLYTKIKFLFDNRGIFVIPISIERLQFNILEHDLVPKHYVMSEDEVAEMCKKYNLTPENAVSRLPEISRFDPVAMCIFLRPGQLCHIIRKSENSVTADYYRACV